MLLDEVVDIDPVARQVRMRSGGEQGYDVLILATDLSMSTSVTTSGESWRLD